MSRRIDLVGQKFGKLTVIKLSHIKRKSYWLCRCDCGNETIVIGSNLRNGHTKSCECLRVLSAHKNGLNTRTHGMSNTRFNIIWSGLKGRCDNKNNSAFEYYGGRGIKCLWKSFEEFKDDMYEEYLKHVEKHGEKQTSIDRIDSNGDYCKENCRWATWKEQRHNRRNNFLIH